MSLRHQRLSDSLDMLLDTMCNTFGGIILLAVLVTLLSSRERTTSPVRESQSVEEIQRRLQIAETALRKSLVLAGSLEAKAAEPRWKDQASLLESRRRIQQEIIAIRGQSSTNLQDLEAESIQSPSDRMKKLENQTSAAEMQRLDVMNRVDAVRSNLTRLVKQNNELDKQRVELAKDTTRELRLPKERDTSLKGIHVILRYGRVFPIRNYDLSQNETDILWQDHPKGETAEAVRGRGIDPAAGGGARIEEYFKQLRLQLPNKTVYIAFLVYDDSFPVFNRVKQMVVHQNLEYGWEPYRDSHGPILFVREGGKNPKPQ